MTHPENPPADDDLRQLFDDATADIRPQGTFDEIRIRTEKVDPMARRWFVPSLAAAAVMALVIGGAFFATRDNDGPSTPGPAGSPTVDATGSPADKITRNTPVFYLGDGAREPRLFSESRELEADDADGIGLAAATAAIAGPPLDADYRTGWPEGLSVEGVQDGGDTIRVSFADGSAAEQPRGSSPEEAQASVHALVRTVRAAYDSDAGVEFLIADEPADQVLGVDTSTPQTGGTDLDVLALVQITSPKNNQTVPAGEKFTVTGVAAAFEANVTWELLVGGDAVVDSGFTTAEECCRLAPYSFDLTLEPGTYTLVVHDTDESGEGRPVNQDTKEIVVE